MTAIASTPYSAFLLVGGWCVVLSGAWLLVYAVRRLIRRPAWAVARDARSGRDQAAPVVLRGHHGRTDPARRALTASRASVLPPATGRVPIHSFTSAPTVPPAFHGDAGGRRAGRDRPPPYGHRPALYNSVVAPVNGGGATTHVLSVPSMPGVGSGGLDGRTFRFGRIPMGSHPSTPWGVRPGGEVAAADAVLRGAATAAATTSTPGHGGTVHDAPSTGVRGLVYGAQTTAVARFAAPARPGRHAAMPHEAGRAYTSAPATRQRVPTDALAAYHPVVVAAGAPQELARAAEVQSTARTEINR